MNVGGTGKLPMSDLERDMRRTRAVTGRADLHRERQCRVQRARHPPRSVKSASRRHAPRCAHAGKPCGRCVARTAIAELAAVLKANPFPKAAQNRAVAIFLEAPPPKDALKQRRRSRTQRRDAPRRARDLRCTIRMVSVSRSSAIPAAKSGTARNMNTVAKLVEIAERSVALQRRLQLQMIQPVHRLDVDAPLLAALLDIERHGRAGRAGGPDLAVEIREAARRLACDADDFVAACGCRPFRPGPPGVTRETKSRPRTSSAATPSQGRAGPAT